MTRLIPLLLLLAGVDAGPARAAEAPEARWTELMRRLVETNSGSGNPEGLQKARALLIPEFERLGLRAHVFDVGPGHKVVSFEHPEAAPEVLLVGHVDTVFPEGDKFQAFSSDEDGFRGPGIIDMKGAIVMMLDALSRLDEASRRRVRVVLNDDEEIGSVHSREKLRELARGLRYGLVFEPGLPDGALVTSHSGVHWLELKVRGRAAHAGLEPEKGINACVELAHKAAEIHRLTDYSKRLTVNVGTLSGGIAPNVVCEEASARIDIRYVERSDLDRTLERIERIARASTVKTAVRGGTTTAELRELAHIPSMPDPSTKTLLEAARAAGASIGQKVAGRHVGYGSDANQLASTGMHLLVGLGPYGGGMHTDGERMSRRSYGERLRLTEALLRSILTGLPAN